MFDYRAILKDMPTDDVAAAMQVFERVNEALESESIETKDDVRNCCIVMERVAVRTELFVPPKGDRNSTEHLNALLIRYEHAISQHEMGAVSSSIDEILDANENRGAEDSFGYAYLKGEEKELIRDKLTRILAVIEESQLPPRKKNAIRAKIVKLLEETEADGTKVDNFLGLLVDVSLTAKHMRGNLKEIVGDAKDIFRIVYKRRAEDEQAQLPPPETFEQIEDLSSTLDRDGDE